VGTSFREFMREVEAEARREGPLAVAELAFLQAQYQLAADLILLRRRRRMSLRQVSAKSRVPLAEVRNIEGGRANPALETISALARSLGGELKLTPATSGRRKKAPRTAARRTGRKR